MDFSQMLSDLLSNKSVVIININDKAQKEKDDRLAMLIERLLLTMKDIKPKASPMG
jgi:hypothetical protein